jgi:hypothetical protein
VKIIIAFKVSAFIGFLFIQMTYAQFQSEGELSIDKGILQLEITFLNQSEGVGTEKTDYQQLPNNLLRYGVSNNTEIRLVINLEGTQQDSGQGLEYKIGSTQLGAKVAFNKQNDSKTKGAFFSHLIFPKNWNDFSSSFGYSNQLVLKQNINSKFSLTSNFGYTHFNNSIGYYNYTAVAVLNISNKFSLFVEPYGVFDAKSNSVSNIDFGFSYYLANLQFDFAIGTGIDNKMIHQGMVITWRPLTKLLKTIVD